MSALLEVWRHTFPKHLRFDQASQILYAECYSVARRYKHKKYIPKDEIRAVLDGYERLPGAPFTQMPVVRHLLFVRVINSVRWHFGGRSWLYRAGAEAEYNKIAAWLAKQDAATTAAAAAASTAGGRGSSGPERARARRATLVEREAFEREVLGNFHVASMYQRMVRLGIATAGLLTAVLLCATNMDYVLYVYMRWWEGRARADVLAYYREVTERHTTAEVPEAYASLLPPPCVRYTTRDGVPSYAVNLVELRSPRSPVAVLMVPCPQAAPKRFYESIGDVAVECDAVLLEGVCMDDLDKMTPASFFPLRDDTFPALGLHHRFLDILRSGREPPQLFPAATRPGRGLFWRQALTPLELRCFYEPTATSASKGEARVGWGYMRAALEHMAMVGDGRPQMLCVPWTVNQCVNLEASLIKYGYKVSKVFPVHWIEQDYAGEHFCDYFGIH